MEWTRRRIWALVFVGFITVFVAAPVLGAIFDNTVEQSGDVSYVAPNGPNATLVGDTNVSLNDPSQVFPFSNTVNLTTEAGNFTAISNGDTNFTIQTTEITGAYTNITGVDASSNSLTVDPEDKAKISLNGDAEFAYWTDYQLDDGTTDLVIGNSTGGSTDVTFYGLQADTLVTAVNKTTDTPLAIGTTDSNGDITFTISHSTQTVLLQSGDQTSIPEQSNPSPTGKLQQEPTQISIDVNDTDFPDDEVSVDIDLDGSDLTSTTLTQNDTVTAAIPASGKLAGDHSWTVNTTDKYGNTRIETYDYRVPGELYIRNETNTSQLVDSPVNVTVRFLADDEIIERSTDTGIVDLTGSPQSPR